MVLLWLNIGRQRSYDLSHVISYESYDMTHFYCITNGHSLMVKKGIVGGQIIEKVQPCKKDPDGEIENSGKSIFKIRIPNFCYIQVMVFAKAIYQWQRLGRSKSATTKKL